MPTEALNGSGDSHFAWLRRAGMSLIIAGTVLSVLKIKGGATPPTRGGWRFLTPEDLADDVNLPPDVAMSEVSAPPLPEAPVEEPHE